jgi:multidrug efflux system membrane fusion protein
MSIRRLVLLFVVMTPVLVTLGCRQAVRPQADSKLPVFTVSNPVKREVTDYVEYTGRTAAVQAEEIKARVTGFLVEMPFQEGKEIKEGDILFKIDDRPYKAQYDQAEAQVGLYQSQLKLAKANYERDQELFKRTNGAGVSKQALDADLAQQEQAEAALKAAQASLEVYKLNLDFTTVKAPIDGQVGRYNQPRGNLVMQDSTLLTTVQSVDPMHVYFDMDMPSYRKFQANMQEDPKAKITVSMALQGEEGYPRTGTVDFFNNLVNPATDTLLVRSVFPNPKKAIGRALKPGMFVRVNLPTSKPHEALLVIDQAITSIQGRKNLYVLDDKDTVLELPVSIGQLQSDGLRVVQGKGLDEKSRVIVSKLLQVRPKTQVQPVLQPMPTYLGAQPAAAPPSEKHKAK